jgi:CheY-like chemotaxis protein
MSDKSEVPADPLAADTSEQRRTSHVAVLLVDDDDVMRTIEADILTALGYDVLQAADGDAALEILNNGSPIDVLLTDVVMTGIRGPDLARRARALHPILPIVFISGYADLTGIVGDGLPYRLIKKPFRPVDLFRQIEAARAEAQPSAARSPAGSAGGF